MIGRLGVLAALVAAAAGCGGDDSADAPPPTATATEPPAESTSAAPSSGANAFIGSLAADPGGPTLILGTGLGLFRSDGGAKARRVVGELRTPDGAGQVSSNLVVRYAGPGRLLASGHPEGASSLPENLGLIRSADGGRTWRPVSLLGGADFHILQAAGDRIAAVRAGASDVEVSRDGGRTFDARSAPAAPVDVAFDPEDPARMVVATEQGIATSGDEGRSWRPRDPAPAEQLAWIAPDELYRADPGGLIKVSADGGETWKERGTVGSSVNELAAGEEASLIASVAGGEVRRSTDGGATWEKYLKLG